MIRFVSGSRRVLDLLTGVALGVALTALVVEVRGADEAAPPGAYPGRAEAAPASGFRATALAVIDGDTFEARVAAFPGQEIVARVRLDGVDTPERRGRCAAETAAAEAAARALGALVEGRRLTLSDVRGDKYFGRVVARVSGAGIGDLAQAMIAGGHGRAYAGGRRESWC